MRRPICGHCGRPIVGEGLDGVPLAVSSMNRDTVTMVCEECFAGLMPVCLGSYLGHQLDLLADVMSQISTDWRWDADLRRWVPLPDGLLWDPDQERWVPAPDGGGTL